MTMPTISDVGIEIPTFKPKPFLACPPSGLVINPQVGCVNIWTEAAANSSDIVRPYSAAEYPLAEVDPSLIEKGLAIARKNGWGQQQIAATMSAPTYVAPPSSEALDAFTLFQAPDFITRPQ